MTCGSKICETRTKMGISQEKLGEIVGVSRQTVSKWELDEAFPEPSKLIRLCRYIGVSADELLSYLGTSDDVVMDGYGVYRGDNKEIVLTSCFALSLYSGGDKMGMRLYRGDDKRKSLCAICERDLKSKTTEYSFITEKSGDIISSGKQIDSLIGTEFDKSVLKDMRMIEKINIDRSGMPLPSVGEYGVARCLSEWRKMSEYHSESSHFSFNLCTDRLEYVFSIMPEHENIYCGASNNRVFDLGLIGGSQYFRLRNYDDNDKPFCAFYADLSYEPVDIKIPAAEVNTTVACNVMNASGSHVGSSGMVFFVKRYSDDMIILAGCGGDEYGYYRDGAYCEKII